MNYNYNNEINLLLKYNIQINFAPQTLEQEIAQNIITIFTTAKFSVPLDRDFGLDATLLDMPQNTAKALLASEIVSAIETFEPRVRITHIDFQGDNNGLTLPAIKFIISSPA